MIFLSTLVSKDQSKWRANKNEHGERCIMLIRIEFGFTMKRVRDMTRTYSLIRMFVLKVINNEKKPVMKSLIALQSKLCWWSLECVKNQWIHPNLRRPLVSFTYLFQFTYFCFVYVGTLKKGILLKKIRSHSQPLRLQQHITIFHKFT